MVTEKNGIIAVMIPKSIHYIWLGKSKKPKNFNDVYASWCLHAKGFSLKEWTEEDIKEFDLPEYFYKSLQRRRWAFASDVLRFFILEKYGGIYLDIDEVLLRSVDSQELLSQKSFLGEYHEVNDYFGFGFIGAEKNSIFCQCMTDFYRSYKEEGDIIVNVIGSRVALDLQKKDKTLVTFFPQEYFYPLFPEHFTKNTYAKHLSNTSWIPVWKKVVHRLPFYFLIKKIVFFFLPKFLLKRIAHITY